jgi:hypothetical protein
MFDQDRPRAREKAQAQRILRSVDDPNEVFIYLEYETVEYANEARTRLVLSGVLERFDDKARPYRPYRRRVAPLACASVRGTTLP